MQKGIESFSSFFTDSILRGIKHYFLSGEIIQPIFFRGVTEFHSQNMYKNIDFCFYQATINEI